MPQRPLVAACLALATLLPAAAHADLNAQFDLSVRGIRGGTIAVNGRDQGGNYGVSAAAQATGVVGELVKYGYDAQAQGSIRGGRYVSNSYTEREDDDGERTSAVTRFDGTTPRDVTFSPPREPKPWDIAPSAQRGVVDPLTAFYAILQDTDPSGACNQRHDLFDGRHVSRITLGQPTRASDGRVVCAGEYRRIAGYDPKKMAERPTVTMTFTYTPTSDGRLRVTEISSPTRVGTAVLRRR